MFFDVPDKPPSRRRGVIVGLEMEKGDGDICIEKVLLRAKCTLKLGVVTEEMRLQPAAVVVNVIVAGVILV